MTLKNQNYQAAPADEPTQVVAVAAVGASVFCIEVPVLSTHQ